MTANRPVRKAAAADPTVTLPDPGRPENDLKQLGYQLFKACGLTYLTWAALPLEQHLQAVLQQIPGMRNATVNPVGGGTQGSQDNPDGMWMAYDGPQGSVLAYHVMQSNDFVLQDVAMRLPLIADPLKWGIATVGAQVPAGVAQILAGARAVPLWESSAFAGQRSGGESLDVPPALASGLLGLGWTRIDNDNGFRLDVPLNRGGTQAVFFTPYDAQSFAVVAPLDSSVNGAIPDALRGHTFGHYSLEVIADMIVLCERFPAGPPAPDPAAVTAAGRAVTLYGEQQFAGPAPAQAHQPPTPVSPRGSTAYPVAGGPIPPGFSYLPPAAANPSPAPASAYSTVPAARAGAAARTTRFGGLTPRHWAILAAAVVAVLVVVGAVNAFSGSSDTTTHNSAGAGSNDPAIAPVASAPGSTSTIQGFPGTDAQGFLAYPSAQCDPGSTAAVLARTTKSAVVVCRSGPGSFYYRAVRVSDGASIELANAVHSSDGFDVLNPANGVVYQVRPNQVAIVEPDGREELEPVVQYASG